MAEYQWLLSFSEVDEGCDDTDLQAEGHHKTLQLTMAVFCSALAPIRARFGRRRRRQRTRRADVPVTVAVLVGGSHYQTALGVELPQEEEGFDEELEDTAFRDAPVLRIDVRKPRGPEACGREAIGTGGAGRPTVEVGNGADDAEGGRVGAPVIAPPGCGR